MEKSFKMSKEMHDAICHLPREKYGEIMYALCDNLFHGSTNYLEGELASICRLLKMKVTKKSVWQIMVKLLWD